MLAPGLQFEGGRWPLPPEAAGWAKGKPEEAAVSMMVLRSLDEGPFTRRGELHTSAWRPNTTATSLPIRRYCPDLMVHRIPHRPAGREAVRRTEQG